jgi:hypothetical protein
LIICELIAIIVDAIGDGSIGTIKGDIKENWNE